jgi:hypothetical protein
LWRFFFLAMTVSLPRAREARTSTLPVSPAISRRRHDAVASTRVRASKWLASIPTLLFAQALPDEPVCRTCRRLDAVPLDVRRRPAPETLGRQAARSILRGPAPMRYQYKRARSSVRTRRCSGDRSSGRWATLWQKPQDYPQLHPQLCSTASRTTLFARQTLYAEESKGRGDGARHDGVRGGRRQRYLTHAGASRHGWVCL